MLAIFLAPLFILIYVFVMADVGAWEDPTDPTGLARAQAKRQRRQRRAAATEPDYARLYARLARRLGQALRRSRQGLQRSVCDLYLFRIYRRGLLRLQRQRGNS